MKYIEKQVNISNKNLIPEDSLFFDIETTGFSRKMGRIYLIGTLAKENDKFIFRQYMTESQVEEKEMIKEFIKMIQSYEYLISFNGESFDFSFIEERAKKYFIDVNFKNFKSIDIYKKIKEKSYFLELNNFKLKTLEKYLGIYREDIFSGGELISLYYEYENGNKKLEQTLLLHNEEDILNLPSLFKFIEIIEENNKIKFDNLEFIIDNIKLNKNLLEVKGKANLEKAFLTKNNTSLIINDNVFLFKSLVKEDNYNKDIKCIYIEKGELKLICEYNIPSPEKIYLLKHDKKILYKNIKHYITISFKTLFNKITR